MRIIWIIVRTVIFLQALPIICHAASWEYCGHQDDGESCCICKVKTSDCLSVCPEGLFQTPTDDVGVICVPPTTPPPTTVQLPTTSGNVTANVTGNVTVTSFQSSISAMISTTQFSNTTVENDTKSTTIFATPDPDSAGPIVENVVCVPTCPQGFYGNITDRVCMPCDVECANCTDGPSKCDNCQNGMVIKNGLCQKEEATSNTGLIAGLVVGSVVAVVVLVIIVCCCRRRCPTKEDEQGGLKTDTQIPTDDSIYVNLKELQDETQDKGFPRYTPAPTQPVTTNVESTEYSYADVQYPAERNEVQEIEQLPLAPGPPPSGKSTDTANYGYDVPGNTNVTDISSTHQAEIENVNEQYDVPEKSRKVSDIKRNFENKAASSRHPLASRGAKTEPQPTEVQDMYEPMEISDEIYQNVNEKDGGQSEDYYNVDEIRESSQNYYNQGQDDDELYCNEVAPDDDDQGTYEEMIGSG